MPKTDRFELRLSPEEKQMAIAKAQAWGLSLSDYVRMLIELRDPPKQVTDVAWDTFSKLGQVYNQLSRIGCTIKQLSKLADAPSEISPSLSQELEKLQPVLLELQHLVLEVRSQIDREAGD